MYDTFSFNPEILLRLKYPVSILKMIFFKILSLFRKTPSKNIILNYFGLKIYGIPSRSILAYTIYQYHSHELIVTELIKRKITKNMTVLDIGAYHGYYTLLASKLVGNHGKVYAFEPLTHSLNTLKDNITLNNFKNITISDYALHSEKIDLPLRNRHEASCIDLICKDVPETLSVAHCISFDEFSKQLNIGKVDFVKMDIEGSELKALQGMENTLRTYKPQLLIELHPRKITQFNHTINDLVTFLHDLSYKIKPIDIFQSTFDDIISGKESRYVLFHVYCY